MWDTLEDTLVVLWCTLVGHSCGIGPLYKSPRSPTTRRAYRLHTRVPGPGRFPMARGHPLSAKSMPDQLRTVANSCTRWQTRRPCHANNALPLYRLPKFNENSLLRIWKKPIVSICVYIEVDQNSFLLKGNSSPNKLLSRVLRELHV